MGNTHKTVTLFSAKRHRFSMPFCCLVSVMTKADNPPNHNKYQFPVFFDRQFFWRRGLQLFSPYHLIRQLRPDAYTKAEEDLKILLADLIVEVQNGKEYNTAYDEARIMIYKATDASFNPDTDMAGDFCYWNVPPVDNAYFTVARNLLLEAQK